MIRSYRIFVGKVQIKRYAIFELTVVVIIAAGIVNKAASVERLNSVINGVAPLLCAGFFPLGFIILLAVIYNINIPEQPCGYKYFHSLENSALHFQNAILFHNTVSAAAILCFFAVMTFFFVPNAMLIMAWFVFLALGMMNFLGHTRSVWCVLVPHCLVGMSVGFYASAHDEGVFGSEMFMTVLGSVSTAVYIAGTVFAIARARAVWEKESDK